MPAYVRAAVGYLHRRGARTLTRIIHRGPPGPGRRLSDLRRRRQRLGHAARQEMPALSAPGRRSRRTLMEGRSPRRRPVGKSISTCSAWIPPSRVPWSGGVHGGGAARLRVAELGRSRWADHPHPPRGRSPVPTAVVCHPGEGRPDRHHLPQHRRNAASTRSRSGEGRPPATASPPPATSPDSTYAAPRDPRCETDMIRIGTDPTPRTRRAGAASASPRPPRGGRAGSGRGGRSRPWRVRGRGRW